MDDLNYLILKLSIQLQQLRHGLRVSKQTNRREQRKPKNRPTHTWSIDSGQRHQRNSVETDFLCASNQPGPMLGTRGGEEAERGDNGGRGLPPFGDSGWSYAMCVCVCVCVCKRLTFLLRGPGSSGQLGETLRTEQLPATSKPVFSAEGYCTVALLGRATENQRCTLMKSRCQEGCSLGPQVLSAPVCFIQQPGQANYPPPHAASTKQLSGDQSRGKRFQRQLEGLRAKPRGTGAGGWQAERPEWSGNGDET